MFKRGFWEHEKFMDVFIEVLKVQYHGSEYTKLEVRWWNRGFDGSDPWLILDKPQKIKVLREKYKEWRRYNGGNPEISGTLIGRDWDSYLRATSKSKN